MTHVRESPHRPEGMCLVACAERRTLDRAMLLLGAVAERGGSVILLTPAPGQALRETFFGLEVVVRHDEDLAVELLRLEALCLSRGAGVLLLDDPRLSDEHVAAVRVLSEHVAVACYGPALLGGAGGELSIDPYHDPGAGPYGDLSGEGGAAPSPLSIGGCFGLSYLPLHPRFRMLRERRRGPGADTAEEVQQVTVACDDDPDESLSVRTLDALSIWRPTLRVVLLHDPARPGAELEAAARRSRHEVALRPPGPLPSSSQALGEWLLCDLAIVDDPDRAALAAYLGTPTVLLTRTAVGARRGQSLARQGVALHVPLCGPGALSPELYADLLWSLCADPGRRGGLAQAARRQIDGYGADRVATALFDLNQARGGRHASY